MPITQQMNYLKTQIKLNETKQRKFKLHTRERKQSLNSYKKSILTEMNSLCLP